MVTLTLLDPNTHKSLQQWSFKDNSVIRIGRHSDNDIVLKQFLQVSRHHLELKKTEDGWHLISQGTNGTFVNGILVSEELLLDNVLIQLAANGPLLRFEIEGKDSVENKPVNICTHFGNHPNNLFCVHCGKPLVEQEQYIHQYQILRILGRGGMGTTYLAWDRTRTHTKVPFLLVLKEMNADMMRIAKARELFEREARVLKTLDHPGIPKYYDFFVENNRKYLAMELIHGQNLEQTIYQKGPVTAEKGVKWMIQVCDVLDYLHSLEPPLVHRDVKPANLMLRNLDARLMLLDFGAVMEIGSSLGTRIGVEGYSAPEQHRGKPCPQSDLYAIGPTLIFLLTGKSPMEYYRRKGFIYKFDVSSIPSITLELGKVIEKACEANGSDRYQTAQELSQALAACL